MIREINLTPGGVSCHGVCDHFPRRVKIRVLLQPFKLSVEMMMGEVQVGGGRSALVSEHSYAEKHLRVMRFYVCLFPRQGCLTTPNSPSVNPRSTTLGPSLSLGSISGVSVKSDLKKRRAPPPPSLPCAGPPVQDKTSEKVGRGRHSGPGLLLNEPMNSLEGVCAPCHPSSLWL